MQLVGKLSWERLQCVGQTTCTAMESEKLSHNRGDVVLSILAVHVASRQADSLSSYEKIRSSFVELECTLPFPKQPSTFRDSKSNEPIIYNSATQYPSPVHHRRRNHVKSPPLTHKCSLPANVFTRHVNVCAHAELASTSTSGRNLFIFAN